MSPEATNPSGLSLIEEFKVPAEDIDANGRMKFFRICSYLFEMATIHARQLKYGFEDMQQENHYWVLSRLLVHVNHYPEFDQNIVIETWTKGTNRLFALRDFCITDQEKNVLALAATAWLALDKTTGRPGKPEYMAQFHSLHAGRHAIQELPGKIDPPEPGHLEASIPVRYSDLDINKHVNAGRYIAWVQDQFPLEHYQQNQIETFQINYHNETRFGETVQLYFSPGKETDANNLIEGKIENSGSTAFRARIEWVKARY
jgi:medium-chain acyl-[acyl-carrier-protein] hydrolase